MPAKKYDYINILNDIENENNINFSYDGNLTSHTSVSCDCIIESCNNKCKRSCRDLVNDRLILCTIHLTENRLKNKYGTKEYFIETIKNTIDTNGIEILTTNGLKKMGFLQHINYHKISVEYLQNKFEYKKILLEKRHNQLKETVKKLVDNNGAKVLFWAWLEDNTEKDFLKEFKYACSINSNLLLKQLSIEFQVENEWKGIYKDNHSQQISLIANGKKEIKLIKYLEEFKKMYYDTGDISVFNALWLDENYHEMYRCFRNNKLSLKQIASDFGISVEYNNYYRSLITVSSGKIVRTEDGFHKIAIEVLSMWGYFPSASILLNNGFGHFVGLIYQFNKTFDILNKEYHIQCNQHLTTVTGEKLQSQSEVCFVNFLYSRGIEQSKGENYHEDYTELYGRKGIYDRQFIGKIGIYEKKIIHVEIWGGCKNRSKQEEYNNKRKEKEHYHKNKGNIIFLGIEYEDCYSESKLEEMLKPYIGVIKPFNFRNEEERKISCEKWHLIYDIRKGCEYIFENNNNELPSISWMRRDKSIVRNDWEICQNFNIINFSYKIDRFGGIQKVKKYIDSLK